MLVIGCDFHPSWQQVCWVDTMTGETEEKKLVHGSGDWMLRTQKPYPQIVSYREQLAGGPGRRKLDRKIDWALSSRS